jgi:hypothetical protein
MCFASSSSVIGDADVDVVEAAVEFGFEVEVGVVHDATIPPTMARRAIAIHR